MTSVRSAVDLRDPRGWALLLAVSAPLWWVPGGFSRFVLAPLLVTVVAVLLAAVVRPVGALPRTVVVLGVAWAGVFALAAVTGDTPLASLVGRWPRYEGLPTLAVYAGACWVGARVTGRGAPAADRLGAAVALMAIVLAGFSVLDAVGVTPLGATTEDRSGSVLGNATDQGAVAMMAALVLAGWVLRGSLPRTSSSRPSDAGAGRRNEAPVGTAGAPVAGVSLRRWLASSLPGYSTSVVLGVVGLVAALATVAISGSRTALVLTAVGLLALALSLGRAHRVAVGGALALLAVVALLVPTTRDRLLGLGSAEGRLHQWRLTLDLVLDHPLLGIGGSRYLDAFPAYEDAAFVDFTGAGRLADSPHSVLLQVLVAGGLLLLAATVLGAGFVAWEARAALREHPEAWPAALAVAAYLALACVNFTTAAPTCLAALLLGTVIAGPPPRREPVRARLPVAVGSGALALVLAAALVGEVQLRQGVDAADRGDAARAGEALDRAAGWRPWDADIRLIGARALAGTAALGDVEAARRSEALARESLERVPDSYEALVALGLSLSAQGRVDEALAPLDRAVGLAPERPDGYVQRAIARAGLGDLDAALDDLERAERIVPRSPVVRRLLRQVGRLPG